MTAEIDKSLAIQLLYYSRQAVRSLDKLLAVPSKWQEFLSFYLAERRDTLVRLIGSLNPAAHPLRAHNISCSHATLLSIVLTPIRIVVNRFRRRWYLGDPQLSFVICSLGRMVSVLSLPEYPPQKEIVAMRVDLHACYVFLANLVIGLPEVRRLVHIEHFDQPFHITPVLPADLGI